MEDRTFPLDAETKVAERPNDHKTELRLWLRLLTCTTLIEGEVRRRLRETIRRHAAALRSAGAARSRAERHDARRTVAAHDGDERQHHRPGRPARRAGAGQAAAVAQRPPGADTSASRRTGKRPSAPWRAPTPTGSPKYSPSFRATISTTLMRVLAKTKVIRPQGHRQRERTMSAANPVTLPLSGYRGRHIRLHDRTARSRPSRSTGPTRRTR